jgi:hypothetical protein
MSVDLQPLYMLTGTAVVERLGRVQDGERLKVELRGSTAPDSPIAGKAHGSTWILAGPLGLGETSAVQEIITPERERVVVELRGYTIDRGGGAMLVRASGLIRSSAPRFADIDGHIAIVEQFVAADGSVRIDAFKL